MDSRPRRILLDEPAQNIPADVPNPPPERLGFHSPAPQKEKPEAPGERIVVRTMKPDQWDIDGSVEIVMVIHDEFPEIIPYYPRIGRKWSFQLSRLSPEIIVCNIPPVSQAGSVEVTFWMDLSDNKIIRVPNSPCQFEYKDRSARKV
jgi:hypothetical protein